ncbi:MAG: hypothetical protein IT426_11480 [Pirellulales bacterium]|nr:hypothetical protein [Pirellulales bacterium]
MKNILKILGMLALCVCVGTVIAQMLVAAVLLPKLKLDRARFSRIAAIAQGIDVAEKEEVKGPPPLEAEQPSYSEIVEVRAVKYRNLELREQQLRNNLLQVQSQESKLADDLNRYKQLSDNFQAQLAAVRQSAATTGMDDVLRTLVSIDPAQAKGLLLDMLDKKEIDAVVSLMKQMPDKKRANIIGEFKTDEETEKLSEVLRRIREGMPEMKAVENAQAKLETNRLPRNVEGAIGKNYEEPSRQ